MWHNFLVASRVCFFSLFVLPVLAAPLEVKFLNVGQADAALIRCPDGRHRMVIDAGDTRYPDSSAQFRSAITDLLGGTGQEITVAVASHPHEDHIGSMRWLLENFSVGTYVDNGDRRDTTNFGKLDATRRKLIRAGKLTYINGKENSFASIDFCPDVTVEIFSAWAVESLSDLNDRSVGVRISYDDISFLFVGDMHEEAEHAMLARFSPEERAKLRATVLKAGHHGSDTSSTAEFITAVAPEVVVVSCGKKGVGTNSGYKHPRLTTVRHYADWTKAHPPLRRASDGKVWSYDAKNKRWKFEPRPEDTWLTVNDGTVTITTDGQSLNITSEN